MAPRKRVGKERRRHPRGNVAASALLFSGEHWRGPYPVLDLSVGGARLGGPVEPAQDAWVRVLLRLPGHADLTLAAKIVWEEPAGGAFALSFLEVTPEDEDVIARALAPDRA